MIFKTAAVRSGAQICLGNNFSTTTANAAASEAVSLLCPMSLLCPIMLIARSYDIEMLPR